MAAGEASCPVDRGGAALTDGGDRAGDLHEGHRVRRRLLLRRSRSPDVLRRLVLASPSGSFLPNTDTKCPNRARSFLFSPHPCVTSALARVGFSGPWLDLYIRHGGEALSPDPAVLLSPVVIQTDHLSSTSSSLLSFNHHLPLPPTTFPFPSSSARCLRPHCAGFSSPSRPTETFHDAGLARDSKTFHLRVSSRGQLYRACLANPRFGRFQHAGSFLR